MRLFPIKKNRVLLINSLAENYSDNLKYIAENLTKNYAGKFELLFSVKEPKRFTGPTAELTPIKNNSLQYFYYGMTSQVLVTNSGFISYLPLKREQYIINTWHGGGAYKKYGIDICKNSHIYRKTLLFSANATSAFLSTCKSASNVFTNALLIQPDAIWEIGMPRNDVLINRDMKLGEMVRTKIGLKEHERLVLFAPTYRKIKDNDFCDSIAISYDIDAKRVCQALQRRFGGTWKFAVRFHPCIVNKTSVITDDMIDLTDYEDMQELLLAADVMINDFSSSIWDFMLTGRPCFLFAKDLEHYIQTAELYTPISEWPFPTSTNNDELEQNILDFDAEKYAADCKHHYEVLGGCETGQASELVCERIHEICFAYR